MIRMLNSFFITTDDCLLIIGYQLMISVVSDANDRRHLCAL